MLVIWKFKELIKFKGNGWGEGSIKWYCVRHGPRPKVFRMIRNWLFGWCIAMSCWYMLITMYLLRANPFQNNLLSRDNFIFINIYPSIHLYCRQPHDELNFFLSNKCNLIALLCVALRCVAQSCWARIWSITSIHTNYVSTCSFVSIVTFEEEIKRRMEKKHFCCQVSI